MKNLFSLLGLLCLISCNQQKTVTEKGYTINGEVTNFKERTVLYLDDPDIQTRIDSTTIINGKFQFKGETEEPKRFYLSTKYNGKIDDHKYTSVWVDKGVVTLEGDYNDFRYAKVQGLLLHEISNKLSKLQETNNRKIDSLSKFYNDKSIDRKLVSLAIEKIYNANDSISMNFIKKNPNNYVSLNQVRFLKDKFSKEELLVIYNALNEKLKQTDKGEALKQYINIDKILEKGDQLADIEGKTLTGNIKKLSDIVRQHKYTILDFWAAGCGPCRSQSKQYKKLHEMYEPKGLAIVSFSLDKNKDNWEKASKEDTISWINISDLKGDDGVVPMTYGVRGIPYSFLINQEGKIVDEFKYYNPKKAPFENKLEEFFGEGTE